MSDPTTPQPDAQITTELSPEPKKRRWMKSLRQLLILVLVLTAFRSAIADWNDVPSGSMKPSIIEGDRVFVNKLAYDLKVPFTTIHLLEWSNPARGDVVVFYSPVDGVRLIKRVVGLPGDVVEMRSNKLYVNGKVATYGPLNPNIRSQVSTNGHTFASETIAGSSHPVMSTPSTHAMRSFKAVTVPADHYYMLGDNRDNSADSRFIGFVPRKNILGKSPMIVLSLDYENHLSPRWGRFFTSLP